MKQISFPVEFRIQPQEGVTSEFLLQPVEQIFAYAYQFITLHPGAVERVVVADPDKLGETIFEFQDSASKARSYTGQKGYFHTVGKTIARRLPDGIVTSTVVIDSRLAYRMLEACIDDLPLDQWDNDLRHWLYCLVHELGHCIDNNLRGDDSDFTINLEEETDWRIITQHYCNVIIGEFLACWHSAQAITPELHQKMITDWHKHVSEMTDQVLRQKMAYYFIAGTNAAHVFWVVLLEYAKIIGHQINNQDLSPVPPWPDAEPEEVEVLNQFAAILPDIIADYPNIPAEETLLTRFLPLWHRLTEGYGFSFSAEEEGDDLESE